MELEIFYVEYFAVSSWGIRFYEKLDIYGGIDLVENMDTYTKRAERAKNLGITSFLLYLF